MKYFKTSDFTCKCGCGKNNISTGLTALLDELREKIDTPIIINSGCRCVSHNKAVGGKMNSAHVDGLAVDIKVNNSPMRFKIISTACKLGFVRIGIGETFIHLDIDLVLTGRIRSSRLTRKVIIVCGITKNNITTILSYLKPKGIQNYWNT